jgi:hypothetical protein
MSSKEKLFKKMFSLKKWIQTYQKGVIIVVKPVENPKPEEIKKHQINKRAER